jgi:hypothetical protein
MQFEPFKNTVIELAYTGNRGVHLYLPLVNINPRDIDFVEFLEANPPAAGGNSDTTFNDPLGRRTLLGSAIAVGRGSIRSPYFGFNTLNKFFDPSATSVRHAGYIDIKRRVGRGLTFTANYTRAKSIDDASDASPDTRVSGYGSTQGHVTYGAPLSVDRSVSTYDIKNNFSATFIYDLPVGSNRSLLGDAPKVVDALVGGWTVSGLLRLSGGVPFLPYITDTNRLGGVNRTVRPNLVEGVPLRNPLWTRDCPTGTNPATNLPCEPYVNPAAFTRPAKGELGNAPRTLDFRAPRQEYFDLSFQKNFKFPFGDDGKRRINFRVDLINAFNHPNFRFSNQTSSGTSGFTDNLPTEFTNEGTPAVAVPITTADYNAWATANGQPLASTSAGAAQLAAIRAQINAFRLPTGPLPANFFSIRVPEGFATLVPNQFDIRTVEGFKLYRLRQQYNTAFGTLREVQSPRYIQFGLRIFF